MADACHQPVIGIVTPTFRRPTLLARFIRRVKRQSYRNWVLVIIHDGPNMILERSLRDISCKDQRISFITTPGRTNDCGNTPRRAGLQHLLLRRDPPDYVVFWDDDNLFFRNALKNVVGYLKRTGFPDACLVRFRYNGATIPPSGTSVSTLTPGQLDTANMVVRPLLGLSAYQQVANNQTLKAKGQLLISDYVAFDHIRREFEDIDPHEGPVIGLHDGLRWLPYLRDLVGVPPLGLRARRWFRKLTLGRVRPRQAGGLE